MFSAKAAERAADLLSKASRPDTQRNRSELVCTGTDAYYDIVRLIRSTTVIEQNTRPFDERERQVRNLGKEGVVAVSEMLTPVRHYQLVLCQRTSLYVRYSDDAEVRQPNEDEQTRQAVESMARVDRRMFGKHRHTIRDAHARSHGILRGELPIYDNLPH